ncbi:MAG: sulfatase [Verrucomicrobiota bacterium]
MARRTGGFNLVAMRFVTCLISTLFSTTLSYAERPLNVLFIAADDMNCDLGVYGHPEVKTPHLERLAKMGVRFDRAYCQQPLCGPSRVSIMTGLRPDTLDMHTLKHELRQKNPDVQTLGQLFQEHGYFSARSGKIYHYGNPSMIGTDANDDPATWNERDNPAGIDKTREDEIHRFAPLKGKGLGISMAWWDPVSADEEHTDGLVASRVIDWIEEKKDEPFFLAAGFYNPHCPYVAPKRYFDLYPLESITVPDLIAAKEDLKDVPPMAIQRDTRNWPYFFGLDEAAAQRCKQAYFACQTFVDAQVGRLLDALEENDLIDHTVIVFWSDHGYFLGEKGLWYKRKAFERSARMPLLIAAPGMAQDAVAQQPVELLDIFPTLADLCDFPVGDHLEGASLRPILEDPEAEWAKPAVTQIWHNANAWGYSMRTPRWRYTEWLEGEAGRELYDHATDPEEVHNLADLPEHADLVSEFSEQLSEYVALSPEKRNQ